MRVCVPSCAVSDFLINAVDGWILKLLLHCKPIMATKRVVNVVVDFPIILYYTSIHPIFAKVISYTHDYHSWILDYLVSGKVTMPDAMHG